MKTFCSAIACIMLLSLTLHPSATPQVAVAALSSDATPADPGATATVKAQKVATMVAATLAARSTATAGPSAAETAEANELATIVAATVAAVDGAGAGEPHAGETRVSPADGAEIVYAPAGEFRMGSSDGLDHEKPVHTVALDGFWLDRTEVTNAQYRYCVDAGACNESDDYDDARYYGDDQPVIVFDWARAARYCEWAGKRLPTEAEWEYAARGPESRMYPWGNTWASRKAKIESEADGYEYTALVGSFPEGASWVGALDMAGNVWEWVSDWYGDYPSGPQVNPKGPDAGDYRVLRGGSWGGPSFDVRGAFRVGGNPGIWGGASGFRCATTS